MDILYASFTGLGGLFLGAFLARRGLRRARAVSAELERRRLAAAEEVGTRLSIELGRARAQADGATLRVEELEDELEQRRTAELALEGERTRATLAAAGLRDELAGRAHSLELARAVAREAEEVRDAQAAELAVLRGQHEELTRAARAAEAGLQGARGELERGSAELVELRAQGDELRARLTALRTESAALGAECEGARAQAEAARAEGARTRAELEHDRAELAALRGSRDETRSRLAAELEEARRACADAEQALSSARAERAALAAEREVLAGELGELRARLAAAADARAEAPDPTPERTLVPEPEVVAESAAEPAREVRPRRAARVLVPAPGQGDLWAE